MPVTFCKVPRKHKFNFIRLITVSYCFNELAVGADYGCRARPNRATLGKLEETNRTRMVRPTPKDLVSWEQPASCYGNCFGAAAKFNEVLFNSYVKQSHLLNQRIGAMDLKFGRNCKNANRFVAYAPYENFAFNDE